MKTSRLIAMLALLWGSACAGTLHAQTAVGPRFIDVPAKPVLFTPEDQTLVERMRRFDPSIDWVIPINVNPKALDYDRFDVFLSDRRVIIHKRANQRDYSGIPSGGTKLYTPQGIHHVRPSPAAWYGYVLLPGDHADDQKGGLRDVRIVRKGRDAVYATIRIDELDYTISTLPSGRHVLTRQDVSRLPDLDNDIILDPGLDTPVQPSTNKTGKNDQTSKNGQMDTIRIAIGFTPAAKQGDYNKFVEDAEKAVDSANQSYVDSGILLKLEIAAFAHPNYTEASVLQSWNDLKQGPQGPLWLVHHARE